MSDLDVPIAKEYLKDGDYGACVDLMKMTRGAPGAAHFCTYWYDIYAGEAEAAAAAHASAVADADRAARDDRAADSMEREEERRRKAAEREESGFWDDYREDYGEKKVLPDIPDKKSSSFDSFTGKSETTMSASIIVVGVFIVGLLYLLFVRRK